MQYHNNKKIAIEINNLSKVFIEHNDLINVYENFNLQIEEGKITAILGPNGCGKSTLIDMILGLESVNSGIIKILGQDASKNRNKVGVVFQGLGLFPWLSVKENLLFGLKNKPIHQFNNPGLMVDRYIERYGLSKFAYAHVGSLSGGMQQKLALARVLITNPEIFIFDEPFSSLDPFSKSKIIGEIKNLNRVLKKTIVFVTHNIQEALDLGQNILVLSSKPIRQSYLFENDKKSKEKTEQEIRKRFSLQ